MENSLRIGLIGLNGIVQLRANGIDALVMKVPDGQQANISFTDICNRMRQLLQENFIMQQGKNFTNVLLFLNPSPYLILFINPDDILDEDRYCNWVKYAQTRVEFGVLTLSAFVDKYLLTGYRNVMTLPVVNTNNISKKFNTVLKETRQALQLQGSGRIRDLDAEISQVSKAGQMQNYSALDIMQKYVLFKPPIYELI